MKLNLQTPGPAAQSKLLFPLITLLAKAVNSALRKRLWHLVTSGSMRTPCVRLRRFRRAAKDEGWSTISDTPRNYSRPSRGRAGKPEACQVQTRGPGQVQTRASGHGGGGGACACRPVRWAAARVRIAARTRCLPTVRLATSKHLALSTPKMRRMRIARKVRTFLLTAQF
jgi:hypothetical protein